MSAADPSFTPAAGLRLFTPVYDIAVRLGMRESQLRDLLLLDAAIEPGMRVLDLACGTGTLAILVKFRFPSCDVVRRRHRRRGPGDRPPEGRARWRDHPVRAAGDQGVTRAIRADRARLLQSRDASPRSTVARARALRRAREALAPHGRIHLVAFAPPSSRRMRLVFYAIQLLDGFAATRDSVRGTMPDHLRDADLHDARELRHLDTGFGTVRFWQAQRSD